MALFQFVDSIAADPTVRLDLNAGALRVSDKGLDLSPPALRRARVSTLLSHGERIPASAWDNRVLKIPLQLVATSADAASAVLQDLARELLRDRNFLRVQLGSVPYFFRTFAAPDYAFQMPKLLVQFGTATLEIPAEPFAYGLPETLPTVFISNDPAGQFPANANTNFEEVLAPWTGVGGVAAQTTSQSWLGFGSAAITPSGVDATVTLQSEDVPCAPGDKMRASCMARVDVNRDVFVQIVWKDIAHAPLSTSNLIFPLLNNEWTPIGVTATAPASTSFAQMQVFMDGTPPTAHVLFIDDAKIYRADNGPGGLWWNIDDIKGDVETPPIIKFINPAFGSSERQILVAVRRGPTDDDPVDNPPVVIPMEDNVRVFPNIDTSMQAGDVGFPSGYLRTTFNTTPSLTNRATVFFGTVATFALRGRYRVFLRYRKTVSADNIRVQLPPNLPVTLPSSTDIKYVDLGTISVPAFNDPIADPMGNPVMISGYGFEVWASRENGVGNLDMDCVVFIPAAGSPASPGDDRLAIITVSDGFVTPANRKIIDAFTETTYSFDAFGLTNKTPMPVAGLFPLLNPGQNNRMYFMTNVGPGGPPDSIFDTTQIEIMYLPRYLMIRSPSA